MSAHVQTGSLMSTVLCRLPASWLAALDAWSHGVALKQRHRRRLAALQPAEPIPYKLTGNLAWRRPERQKP